VNGSVICATEDPAIPRRGSQASLCIVGALNRATFPEFNGANDTTMMNFEVPPQTCVQ